MVLRTDLNFSNLSFCAGLRVGIGVGALSGVGAGVGGLVDQVLQELAAALDLEQPELLVPDHLADRIGDRRVPVTGAVEIADQPLDLGDQRLESDHAGYRACHVGHGLPPLRRPVSRPRRSGCSRPHASGRSPC